MGRGAISGTKDAPEVKPSAELRSTLPEPLKSPSLGKEPPVEPASTEQDSWLERQVLSKLRRDTGG